MHLHIRSLCNQLKFDHLKILISVTDPEIWVSTYMILRSPYIIIICVRFVHWRDLSADM